MRKASCGWELLAHLLPQVLRPIADPALDAEAFHGGLRLVAIDGTRFSLRNTPSISSATVKPEFWNEFEQKVTKITKRTIWNSKRSHPPGETI